MNFLNPYLLGLLAFLPLIVVMYLLKLKRKKVTLPSILLWKKSLEDMIANRPFQRLRNNILLWIQLLIMALIALAAARPFLNMSGFQGESLVVILDNSASMQATDVIPSRLEKARDQIGDMIGDLSRGDRMMLLTLNSSSQVAQPFTDDKNLLQRVLGSIEPTDMTSDCEEAVRILESIDKSEKNVQIYLFSDGVVQNVDNLLNKFEGKIKFITLGEKGNNAAFTQLDLRPNYEKVGTFEIFASMENFGEETLSDVVEFYFNDELVDAQEIEIEPGGVHSVVFNSGTEGGTFRLRLPKKDDLMVDNEVIGTIQPQSSFRVLLVGERNEFLESAFNAHPLSSVSHVDLANYLPAEGYDLTVFDGSPPKDPLAQGNYLFINCLPPVDGFEKTGESDYPIIVDWNPVHPITRFIKFDKIQILKAMKIAIPPQAAILAEAQDGIMLAAIQRPDISLLVLPFHISESNWPLLPSFPMFVNNVIEWLSQMRLSRGRLMVKTGGSIPLHVPESWSEAELVRPNGSRESVAVTPGQILYFAGTERAGTYVLRDRQSGKGMIEFSANLISTDESQIKPHDTLESPRVTIAGIKEIAPMNREIWKWLVLAGLAILALEWYIYCRRSWV